MTLILTNSTQHCLHKFFCSGDVIEFNCTDLLDLAASIDITPSKVEAVVMKTGCYQLLLNIRGYEKIVLVNHCGRYVRLVRANTDFNKSEITGCRVLGVQSR